ncbi:hypothetical protein D9M68_824310 [compost metagenome]
MDDDANVTAVPHRPETLVLRFVELVEAHTRVGGIQLQIEGCRFYGLLLFTRQASQAIGKSVRDPEIHTHSTSLLQANPGS